MDEPEVRQLDPGALIIGAWFTLVGVLAMFLGADTTADALPAVFPLTLVLVGIGLLLPTRARAVRRPVDVESVVDPLDDLDRIDEP